MHLISAAHDLRLFRECERCFWLNYKSPTPRPTAEPSLFEEGARYKLHEYFDKYRGDLPPAMAGQLEGCLHSDAELINHWRNWRKGLRHSDTSMSAVLYGAMDDCLVQDNEYYIPIELRLMSREPFQGELRDREICLDSLTYLLTANGYKTSEFGYVICCYPQSVMQHHALMLEKKVVRIDTDLMRAERLFYGAADLLRKRTPPERDGSCANCAWFDERCVIDKP